MAMKVLTFSKKKLNPPILLHEMNIFFLPHETGLQIGVASVSEKSTFIIILQTSQVCNYLILSVLLHLDKNHGHYSSGDTMMVVDLG